MKYLGISLLVGFVGFSVFGFFGMNSAGSHHNPDVDCIASAILGIECPHDVGPMGVALYQLSAYKIFSLAVINGYLDRFLFFGFALLMYVIFSPHVFMAFQNKFLAGFRREAHSRRTITPKQSFMSWIALHEMSPTARESVVCF